MSESNFVRVKDMEPENEEFLLKLFPGQPDGYAYFGEHNYVLPKLYKNHAEGIRNMPIRKDDVWIATFPRSGTTWTQELTWLICNNLDYEGAAELLAKRFVFIEFGSFFSKASLLVPVVGSGDAGSLMDFEGLSSAPSPRYIKTHLPMSLLPRGLLETARVVYVARDPRDVAVSYYHLSKLLKMFDYNGDFKTYWKIFHNNLGTTWTQELTWLICNDLDYEKAADSLFQRFVFVEFPSFLPKGATNDPVFEEIGTGMLMDYKELVNKPSPRFIKTHLPMSLLSPQLLDTSKVVYVARDPRDVAISYYHHNKLLKIHDFVGDFKDYWKLFLDDLVYWAPFFEHLKEAWEQRNHPNMLFLFYEEMYKDLPGVVRRVAKFFEKEYSDEQIQRLCEHLRIDKMKKNKSVHPEWLQTSPLVKEGAESFIRKGKAGGWKEYFDEEMTAQAEKWMQENLKNTDMRFPEV